MTHAERTESRASPFTPARSTRSTSGTWTSSTAAAGCSTGSSSASASTRTRTTLFTYRGARGADPSRWSASSRTWRCSRSPGLAVQFVREAGARIMLRGLRTLSDMEYEFTMSLMNLHLDPGIETVFLMAKEEFSHVSSSLLRQIAALGGDLTKFLPEPVKKALIAKVTRNP